MASVSFSSINWDYSPKTFELTNDFSFNSDTVLSNSCSSSRCELALIWWGKRCYITNSNWNLYFDWCSNLPARSYTLTNCAWNGFNWCYNSISLKLPDPPVVEDKTVFWSVITWISDTMWEFIPYMVYLWLWTLIISLSFVAVKWLMVWIWNKIKKYFRSK